LGVDRNGPDTTVESEREFSEGRETAEDVRLFNTAEPEEVGDKA